MSATENFTKFPIAYPYVSETTGTTYSVKDLNSMYGIFQYKMRGMKIDSSHFNVEIAESMLKFMRYYKTSMGASPATYIGMLIRQFMSRIDRSTRNKPLEPRNTHGAYEDDTLYISDDMALAPSPDSRMSDTSFFYYVLKNEGPQLETLARMKAYAIPDTEIAEELGIGVRSVVRKKKQLRQMFDEYVEQNS